MLYYAVIAIIVQILCPPGQSGPLNLRPSIFQATLMEIESSVGKSSNLWGFSGKISVEESGLKAHSNGPFRPFN
jgi:hypothetical protein